MQLDSIKRRREQRLRQLREQVNHPEQGDAPFSQETDSNERFSWSERYHDEQSDAMKHSDSHMNPRFILKMIIAFFFVSGVYLVHNVNLPYGSEARSFVQEVFTREFNFQGMASNLERVFGSELAILPPANQETKGQPVWKDVNKEGVYTSPVQGELLVPFIFDGQGIQVAAAKGEPIQAIADGWVVFVGQQDQGGQTVLIQHQDQMISQYKSVGNIQIKLHDWVKSGQAIGTVEGDTLYFSLKKDEQYIDPTSVIPFE
jgi:stage IV sporulation protein FA